MMVNLPNHEAIALLNEYGPLVRRIARSACYSSASIDFADLCRVGEFAVLRAVQSYDPSQGTTIKSYVRRAVRHEIFNEAARFLGVFTVDHRTTSLAAKISKLHAKGKSDEEIAETLSDRNIDADHVRDLRLTYGRRQTYEVNPEDTFEEMSEECTIRDLLKGVVRSPLEEALLNEHLMGDTTIKELAKRFNTYQKRIYAILNDLKERIREAIQGVTE